MIIYKKIKTDQKPGSGCKYTSALETLQIFQLVQLVKIKSSSLAETYL